MNKIISISSYGKDQRYLVGAVKQIELAQNHYSDWEIRIYTDDKNKFSNIKNVKVIEVLDNSWGPFWRFEPLFEDENNITIIRDSDDRITIREVLAVNEWLQSNKKFHTIKDHEAHFEYPIMAGLFGFKGKFNSEIYEAMQEYRREHKYYLSDQIFLASFILPKVKEDMILHSLDSGWFNHTRQRLVNPYCFCGQGYDENDIPLYPHYLGHRIDYSKNILFNEGILTD